MAKKIKIPTKSDTKFTSSQYGYQGNVKNQYGYDPSAVDFFEDESKEESDTRESSSFREDTTDEKLLRLLVKISKKLNEETEKASAATAAKGAEKEVEKAKPKAKPVIETDARDAVAPAQQASAKALGAESDTEDKKSEVSEPSPVTEASMAESKDNASAEPAQKHAASPENASDKNNAAPASAQANASANAEPLNSQTEAAQNMSSMEEDASEVKASAEPQTHQQAPPPAEDNSNNAKKAQELAAPASSQSGASASESKETESEEALPAPEQQKADSNVQGSGGRIIDVADASKDGGPERMEEKDAALDKKEQSHLETHSKAKAQQAGSKIGGLGTNQKKKEDATTKLDKTKDAVVEKTSEKEAEANAGQVGKVADTKPPEVNQDDAKSTLTQSIQASLPQKVEDVDNFKDERIASKIGDKVKATIDAKAGEVTNTFETLDKTPKPEEPRKSVPFADIEQAPVTPAIDAGKDLIPKVDDKTIDLNSYLTESDNLLKKEGIKQEHLDLVDSGDLFEAKKIQGDIDKKAKEEPGKLRAEEKDLHGKNETELKKKEADEKGKMQKERAAGLGGARGSQVGTKGSLEDKKKEVTDHINKIYEDVNKQVQDKLTKLKTDSLAAFNREEAAASSTFENNVSTKMDKFKDERYSGLGGKLNKVHDWFMGIDDLPEVKQIFEEEKAIYITRIDSAISRIINDSQKVIDECKTLIANARKEIDEYVKGLSPALQKIGEEAEKEIQKKLDELDEKVNKAAEELKEELAKKRAEAIANIDKKIEKMKEEMSGFLSKMGDLLLDAALKFFKWALEAAGHSADEIMGIINKGKAVLTAVVSDPIQFLKNLAAAVGGGVKNFGSNIMKHLGEGFMNWLTGQLNSLPIQLPEKFDLKGIVSLTLQVLGLTYASLRNKLSNKVGEDKVQMAETGVEIMMEVKEKGPIAMYDMMADKADSIKNEFIEGAKEWAITNMIKQGLIRLATMINPAGAIVQAVLGIYNGVIFLVNNWDRILAFVNSVFDSISAIASGAIGQAAAFVEKTMAQTIPLILDFIAQQLNLSGIAERITKIIHRIRKPIDQVIDKIIDWITKKVKKLADKLLGKDKKKPGDTDNPHKKDSKDDKLKDKEVGADISFSADGHGHHLWIEVKGNAAEVMVASTPMAVVSLLDKWRKQVDKLPDEKKGKAQGLIAQAQAKYQATKQEATATIPLITEAERVPERVNAAEAADNKTEVSERSLKVFLTQLFELFGDEDGVMERFKDQLQNVDPMAKFEIFEAIERNSKQLATITSWDALVAKLPSLTPNVRRLYEIPMGDQHEFGRKIRNQQASNAFNTALNQSTKTEEKKAELRAEKAEWIENRAPIIHGGTTDKAKLAKDSMLEQITNKNQQGNTTGKLTSYFAESMKGNSTEEHDKYKPKSVLVKAENQTLIVSYEYIVDVDGKEETRKFTSSVSLVEINGSQAVQQSTSGKNLALKTPNTRGKTESVNQVDANKSLQDKGLTNQNLDFDAAHVLADTYLGSGYKEALNLVTTSAEYNREVMKKAEDYIKKELNKVESNVKSSDENNYITFDLTVTAYFNPLTGNEIIDALKKVNGQMAQKDIDGVYELIKASAEPKLCQAVYYNVDAITAHGTNNGPVSASIFTDIGPDNTLKKILIK